MPKPNGGALGFNFRQAEGVQLQAAEPEIGGGVAVFIRLS